MIIDIHTHIFHPRFRENRDRYFAEEPAFKSLYGSPDSKLAGVEELIESMDAEGVQKSVVFGFPWEKADHFQRHNDYILESVERYPDRLIGFCCFSPRSPRASEEAGRCLEAGLSGIGELAVYESGFSSEELPALEDIMQTCLHFNAPLLVHTNEPVGHLYPGKTPMDLSALYNFIQQYPANRIILAHWGGGLFFYGLMKKEVRQALRNVWFDTAASPYLYVPEIYRVAGEIVGFEKILFGSDYPLLKPKRYLEEMASAGLSNEAISKIAGDNAAQLLL
jgi:predicted TIM-barrel fold metal-dependent hydrolase